MQLVLREIFPPSGGHGWVGENQQGTLSPLLRSASCPALYASVRRAWDGVSSIIMGEKVTWRCSGKSFATKASAPMDALAGSSGSIRAAGQLHRWGRLDWRISRAMPGRSVPGRLRSGKHRRSASRERAASRAIGETSAAPVASLPGVGEQFDFLP